jgi:hypothetical protein
VNVWLCVLAFAGIDHWGVDGEVMLVAVKPKRVQSRCFPVYVLHIGRLPLASWLLPFCRRDLSSRDLLRPVGSVVYGHALPYRFR